MSHKPPLRELYENTDAIVSGRVLVTHESGTIHRVNGFGEKSCNVKQAPAAVMKAENVRRSSTTLCRRCWEQLLSFHADKDGSAVARREDTVESSETASVADGGRAQSRHRATDEETIPLTDLPEVVVVSTGGSSTIHAPAEEGPRCHSDPLNTRRVEAKIVRDHYPLCHDCYAVDEIDTGSGAGE